VGDKAKIYSLSSIVRIVSFNGLPAVISDQEIENVRRCAAGGANLEVCTYLEIGERVRVRSGAFKGIEGFVASRTNRCKLIVSVALIQQSVALEIDMDDLEPVPRTSAAQFQPATMQVQ
jgi:transcription antitermination factor NusG